MNAMNMKNILIKTVYLIINNPNKYLKIHHLVHQLLETNTIFRLSILQAKHQKK
jgi:ethanolamine utilization cobalamin adenosyltransferase